jgi:hypothetical protein
MALICWVAVTLALTDASKDAAVVTVTDLTDSDPSQKCTQSKCTFRAALNTALGDTQDTLTINLPAGKLQMAGSYGPFRWSGMPAGRSGIRLQVVGTESGGVITEFPLFSFTEGFESGSGNQSSIAFQKILFQESRPDCGWYFLLQSNLVCSLSISECTFNASGGWGYMGFRGVAVAAQILLERSTFRNTLIDGSQFSSIAPAITVEGCFFFGTGGQIGGNSQTGTLWIDGDSSLLLNIRNSSFVQGTKSSGSDKMYQTGGSVKILAGNATIADSHFEQNEFVAIYCEADLVLNGTSFANNSGCRGYGGVCQGGAVTLAKNATAAIANCSFAIPSNTTDGHNDFLRAEGASATFYCVDGQIGAPVKMSPTRLPASNLPPKELQCAALQYICDTLTGICKQDASGSFPSKAGCSAGCKAQPTPAPCQVPRNCGQHNNSVVCGHTFTGCEFVCGKGSDPGNVGCCHASIHADDICNGCVNQLCKPPPPLPPPITTKYFCVTTPNYHCIESSGGTFPSATECEKGCQQPPTEIARENPSEFQRGPAGHREHPISDALGW